MGPIMQYIYCNFVETDLGTTVAVLVTTQLAIFAAHCAIHLRYGGPEDLFSFNCIIFLGIANGAKVDLKPRLHMRSRYRS